MAGPTTLEHINAILCAAIGIFYFGLLASYAADLARGWGFPIIPDGLIPGVIEVKGWTNALRDNILIEVLAGLFGVMSAMLVYVVCSLIALCYIFAVVLVGGQAPPHFSLLYLAAGVAALTAPYFQTTIAEKFYSIRWANI